MIASHVPTIPVATKRHRIMDTAAAALLRASDSQPRPTPMMAEMPSSESNASALALKPRPGRVAGLEDSPAIWAGQPMLDTVVTNEFVFGANQNPNQPLKFR